MSKEKTNLIVTFYESHYSNKAPYRDEIARFEYKVSVFDSDFVNKIVSNLFDTIMQDWVGNEIDYKVEYIVNNSLNTWEE